MHSHTITSKVYVLDMKRFREREAHVGHWHDRLLRTQDGRQGTLQTGTRACYADINWPGNTELAVRGAARGRTPSCRPTDTSPPSLNPFENQPGRVPD